MVVREIVKFQYMLFLSISKFIKYLIFYQKISTKGKYSTHLLIMLSIISQIITTNLVDALQKSFVPIHQHICLHLPKNKMLMFKSRRLSYFFVG